MEAGANIREHREQAHILIARMVLADANRVHLMSCLTLASNQDDLAVALLFLEAGEDNRIQDVDGETVVVSFTTKRRACTCSPC